MGFRVLAQVALAAGVLSLAAGCGGGGSSSGGGGSDQTYVASAVRACLEQAGVTVLDSDPAYVVGDTSGGTFQVGVGDSYADVAFASSEASAADTEEKAQGMLDALGAKGDDLAFHRGNVAYWQLDESNAPIKALERCL
jgi:hypothetical protein